MRTFIFSRPFSMSNKRDFRIYHLFIILKEENYLEPNSQYLHNLKLRSNLTNFLAFNVSNLIPCYAQAQMSGTFVFIFKIFYCNYRIRNNTNYNCIL